MAKIKAYCLTIEVAGNPDCGYSITFESALKRAFKDPAHTKGWRDAVSKAVFKAGADVFGSNRSAVLQELLENLEDINKRYEQKIRSIPGVPALQIETVDGKRLEIEFSGKANESVQVTFSSTAVSRPAKINGHGTGGIRAAKKEPFPFIGIISAAPVHKKSPKP